MSAPQSSPPHSPHEGVEMPRRTAAPIILAAGIALLAVGWATNVTFLVVGAVIFVAGLAGWIAHLLPGRGHALEPLAEPARRARPVAPAVGTVDSLRRGMPGYRFRLPEKVHPISAGIKGGIVGGLVMPLPALAYGLLSGHGIWLPINLLAGMVLPGVGELSLEELDHFDPTLLTVGAVIHATTSITFGLLYGVLLPTLPPIARPLAWAALLMPLGWTAASFLATGVVDPTVRELIDWPWFVVSQFVFGVVLALIVMSTSRRHAVASGLLGGAIGGALMVLPAMAWGYFSGHGIWYPVNLLAAMVLAPQRAAHGRARRAVSRQLAGGGHGTARRVFARFRTAVRLAPPAVAQGSRSVCLGRDADAPVVDRHQLRPDGHRQPGIAAAGRLAVVRGVAIRVRLGGGDRGGALATSVHRARRRRSDCAMSDRASHNSVMPCVIGVHASARVTALLAMCLAAGCGGYELPGKPSSDDRPTTPSQITDFAALFQQNCTGCHGANGKLGPAPPLNDPVFLAIVPDEQLIDVITNGRTDTPMPAFARRQSGTLTDQQIEIIARGLKEHWKSDKLPQATLPSYAVASGEKSPSEADVERGRKLFASACASCHGRDGQGTDPHETPGAINDPALLALFSNQALRRIIITGRPDLGMPDFADDMGREGDFHPLTDDEISDLVALLASWRTAQPSAAASTAQTD